MESTKEFKSKASNKEIDQVNEALATPQKRILFFVFDGGYGVGHLRRLALIAKILQGPYSCLIVTGHRAVAHWFIPAECEYIHLPSWDSLLESKSLYWGRKPFVKMDKKEVIRLRQEIIKGVIKGYKPDAIFVDHLPLGKEEELADIIKKSKAKKYYVTRGFLNQTEKMAELILGGKPRKFLEQYYDQIIVACDKRVCDFGQQYNLSNKLQDKISYVGYLVEKPSPKSIQNVKKERGLSIQDTWVICSAGGGQIGENLIKKCIELSNFFEDIYFDIILGPRSAISWEENAERYIDKGKLRLHKECDYLPQLHASADIVVTTGGYNSLLEVIQGEARIICCPARIDPRDEQYLHASHLSSYIKIDITTDLSNLKSLLSNSISLLTKEKNNDKRNELNFMGASNIKKILDKNFSM